MIPKTVLFVCTHNSARSQMAEGLLNHLYGDGFQAFSAGTEKTQVRIPAIEAMKRIGIDISHHESKTVGSFGEKEFDIVITVCENAKENCPYIPTRGERLHWSFDDPASATGTDAEKLAVFERVRDEIRKRIEGYFGEL
ncbi:protein-tyrosine-phosphatase [candidate division LCP-89 bacterium B3_LCP]|uniref:Protein-tyrosine-phosphatase n=1 Tax=candidate division LCP-89 bacterium B3_LCP TaxID=2012998 RepID=A0A532UVX0_UNCL8|nr:MAG: protein-tyrosine-phosphatase [candidate division LCP-89 bacterium B3_LCP]